jgi:hypothetical protein
MLGEEQWNWLEAQLKKPAQVSIIVSSIQVISWEKKEWNAGEICLTNVRKLSISLPKNAQEVFLRRCPLW